jgi:hypothetical protein
MMADQGAEPGRVMTFEEMDEAKARRHSSFEFRDQTGLVLWENRVCVHLVFADPHKTDKTVEEWLSIP